MTLLKNDLIGKSVISHNPSPHVSGLVRTDCIDREAGVKLCEHCYGREVTVMRSTLYGNYGRNTGAPVIMVKAP